MAKYMFKFSVIPTDDSWWCTIQKESECVNADTLKDAIDLFVEVMSDKWGVDISKPQNANLKRCIGNLQRVITNVG